MHDWRLFPSVVAPTIMMMLVFTLPLDCTMAAIFMADADDAERARLKRIIRFELLLLGLMILSWLPFMWRVLDIPFIGADSTAHRNGAEYPLRRTIPRFHHCAIATSVA